MRLEHQGQHGRPRERPGNALGDLIISSTSDNFVAWHPATEEIEVFFPYDNGCPLGQKGIEIRVDDGGDYSDSGELPYGTLLFNVIENGQPRWGGLPIQVVDEGSSGILSLAEYLSDTDDTGQPVESRPFASDHGQFKPRTHHR